MRGILPRPRTQGTTECRDPPIEKARPVPARKAQPGCAAGVSPDPAGSQVREDLPARSVGAIAPGTSPRQFPSPHARFSSHMQQPAFSPIAASPRARSSRRREQSAIGKWPQPRVRGPPATPAPDQPASPQAAVRQRSLRRVLAW